MSVVIIAGLTLPSMLAFASKPGLIIGIFPRQKTTATFKHFTPLAQYLSRVLDRTVTLETAPDYSAFMSELNTARYDVVHFNQYHYVRSHKTLGYKVIAMNEEAGKSTIAGAILIKKDSGMESIEQLRNSKIVFGGGPDAMMSYIVPRYLLLQVGLKKGDYSEEFAINPINALLAVHFGKAKAAGVGEVVARLPVMKEQYEMEKYKNLIVSEELAHLPWATKGNMSVELRNKIQHALITLIDSKQGRKILQEANLTAILPANDADYNRHRTIISTVLGEKY